MEDHDHNEECLKFCCSPNADNGIHIPDWHGSQLVEDCEWIVDVPCKNCGMTGSTKIDPTDVMWS